jgi:TRAP-type transport system small permease protein
MKMIIDILTFLDKMVSGILKYIVISFFFLLTVLLTATILQRYIPLGSLLWSEEVIILLFDYMVFLGAAALWINREHISAGDWISTKFIKEERYRHLFRILLELLGMAFAAVLFYFSLMFMLSSMTTGAVTNVMAMPKWYYYICMPVSGGLMIIYSVRNIILEAAQAFGPEQKKAKKQ